MALQIIIHTFRMIFGNFGQALRVSIGPYLIMIVLVFLALAAFGMPMRMSQNPTDMMMNPAMGFLPLLLLPLFLFVTSWVAVAWHRFILLEEYAGLLPAVSGRPIWSYAGKAILLGLIILLVAIPLFFLVGIVASPLMGNGPGGMPIVGMLVFGVVSVLLSVLSLRLGVALVGTALGKPMSFGAAWSATAKVNGVIVNVAILLVLINTLPGALLTPVSMALPIIGAVLQLALTWLSMMLGVSILTTLYGHVIEDRPLIS